MTDFAREPYRQWRTAVFVIVVIVAPLVFGGLIAAAAVTLPSLDSTSLSTAGAHGASTGTGTLGTSDQSSGDATTDPAAIGTPLDVARDSVATASSTAPDNVDGAKVITSYGAEHMLDGDPFTAWRTKGNGAGVDITIIFHGTAKVTAVGLIPGYAKIDPATGVDRFHQEHRITAVNWHFSSGLTRHQTFADQPTEQRIDVDTVADSVRIEILGVRGAASGYDYTPISDVTVIGIYR